MGIFMVHDFLKKYQQELMQQTADKEKVMEKILTHRQETEKFLQLIESENEEVFTDFTPRNVTAKGDAKIAEVKEELEGILAEQDLVEKELSFLRGRLSEVNAAIDECEKKISSHNDPPKGVTLREELKNVLSYLPADPLRAKIELEQLLQKEDS